MAAPDALPAIEVFDHLEEARIDLKWLERLGNLAVPLCLNEVGTETPVLPGLAEVEVSLISDEAIAQVHADFMDDPTATDVITFHHGEILISVDTAEREGPEHGHSIAEETLLYLIHGLLHLNGHTDLAEKEREVMHRCQDRILQELLLGESES
ncbi:MAG: rRNA maturation RNase YbeY [Verrucomicrobiales bacterium]|nr:rRNA maturation RNase YbeY [Verrucomicrobiales bacterium]